MTPPKLVAALAAALLSGFMVTSAVTSIDPTRVQRIETEGSDGEMDLAIGAPEAAVAFAADNDPLKRVLDLSNDDGDDPADTGEVLSIEAEEAPGGDPDTTDTTTGASSTTTTAENEPTTTEPTTTEAPSGETSTSTSAATAAAATDDSTTTSVAATAPPSSRTSDGSTTRPTPAESSTTTEQSTTKPPTTKPPTTTSSTTKPSTTQPPTTKPPTTKPPTTKPPTTKPPTTKPPTTKPPAGSGEFESIRNRNPLFDRYADVPSTRLPLNELTIATSTKDNGAHPDGNFRMACAYSHFAYDDPIVFPNQPGRAHLHMFFGNTAADAFTTTNSLVNSGGGSCNGFELNRSGYWTPAVLDGRGNTIVPDQIILYYKTKDPSATVAPPQGLKIVAGNTHGDTFTAGQRLGWSCGGSGTSYNVSNRIPNNCGNDPINAYIQFPFCWDGRNLDSSDHSSHMAFVNDNQSCPSSHPVRLPQLTFLLYFPPGDTSGWHLSSDRHGGHNSPPGGSLHADWFAGWNDEALDLWIDGCIRASRNCSYGQTGTSRMFAKLNNLQIYDGPNVLPLP